jgi:cysteine-rich repeat protein
MRIDSANDVGRQARVATSGWRWAGVLALAALGCGLETTGVGGDGTDGETTGDGETILPEDGDVRPDDGDVGPEDGDGEVPPGCGNGTVEPGEECDDGNDTARDGCENDCRWTCEGADECDDGDPCNGAETCDADHRCAAGTPPPDGTACTTPGGDAGVCRGGICAAASCGNGTVDTGEQCDDGNTDNTDACLSNCRDASCGDGYAHTGIEQCDDGNAVPADGCEDDCSWSCEVAGDCDDSQECNGAESCSAAHVCETGTPLTDGSSCITTTGAEGACHGGICAAIGCGNGFTDAGEECDDGNADNTDACLSDCRSATCGDGFVRSGTEDCDGAPPRTCTTSCSTTGIQACVGCRWETTCTPPTEICNGLDEDCVGGADNGFTCAVAATETCSTGCGSAGNRTCSTACEWGSCTPPAEICNGLDEDCVGGADNGFACVRGAAQSCTTACASTGNQSCNDSCAWNACVPPAELCNGLDEDCVGGADNGFTCALGASRPCTTTCSTTGTESCNASCTAWNACVPPVEICNGLDEDCTGGADNGFACVLGASQTCTTSCGSTSTQACDSTCSWGSCTPPAETCNGRDDDCVGGADNGFACVQGASESCTVGACTGTRTCSATCEWGACALGPAPANDVCSGTVPLLETARAVTGSTCTATDDTTWTAGAGCTASAGGRDVFYRLVLAARSEVTLTVAAAFNTMLYVRQTDCTGTQVACNDDGPSGGGSSLTTTLNAGTYFVVVDGRDAAASGSFTLTPTITAVPANDACAGAQVITFGTGTAGGGSAVITGTLAGAADDYDGGCGDTDGRDVVYRLTTTGGAQDLFITTIGSATDTVVYLRSGGCGGGNIDCQSAYRSTVDPNVVMVRDNLAAGDYYIIVDGQTAAANGTFRLEVNWTANDVEGDRCGQPFEWAPGDTERCNDTNGESGEYASVGCDGTDRDHVYYLVVPSGATGNYYFHTCNSGTNFDTVLYLRNACQNNAAAAQVSCNDNLPDWICSATSRSAISSFTGRLNPGIYYLFVDGDAQGDYCVRNY